MLALNLHGCRAAFARCGAWKAVDAARIWLMGACIKHQRCQGRPQLVPAMPHPMLQSLLSPRCTCAGTLPSWPDRADLRVYVKPGNDGLCGTVRSSLCLRP